MVGSGGEALRASAVSIAEYTAGEGIPHDDGGNSVTKQVAGNYLTAIAVKKLSD